MEGGPRGLNGEVENLKAELRRLEKALEDPAYRLLTPVEETVDVILIKRENIKYRLAELGRKGARAKRNALPKEERDLINYIVQLLKEGAHLVSYDDFPPRIQKILAYYQEHQEEAEEVIVNHE